MVFGFLCLNCRLKYLHWAFTADILCLVQLTILPLINTYSVNHAHQPHWLRERHYSGSDSYYSSKGHPHGAPEWQRVCICCRMAAQVPFRDSPNSFIASSSPLKNSLPSSNDSLIRARTRNWSQLEFAYISNLFLVYVFHPFVPGVCLLIHVLAAVYVVSGPLYDLFKGSVEASSGGIHCAPASLPMSLPVFPILFHVLAQAPVHASNHWRPPHHFTNKLFSFDNTM